MVALAAGAALFLPGGLVGSDDPREAAGGADPEATDIELQRQINELRSDLLDERQRRIGRQAGVHGMVLVILGVAIGVAGLSSGSTLNSRLSRPKRGSEPRSLDALA